MAWNSPGGGSGGPWGGGGNGGGPWGGRGGSSPQPPDLEDLLRKGQERFRRVLPGGFFSGGRGIGLVVAGAFVLWALSGVYRISPDQQGVVLRFGQWVDTTEPGLHYHLPTPIETVLKPSVTRINRIELGYREVVEGRGTGRSGPKRDVADESRMLTGDENIVEADASLFWRIKDAGKFLFAIRNPEETVKVAGESVLREIIGQTPIEPALSTGKATIEERTRSELQRLLDEYNAGVEITQVQLLQVDPPGQVIDAFNDVQRARADQERLRNEAEAYRNDIIPRARGEAERLLQEAEAYKEQVVNLAQGEAQRFNSVYQAYRQAQDVTARRMYLEAMEDILKGTQKVILDPGAARSGAVPYLPLPALNPTQRTQTPPPAPPAPPAQAPQPAAPAQGGAR